MGILNKFFLNIKKEKVKIDNNFFENFEETLIEADVGPKTAMEILEHLKKISQKQKLNDIDELKTYLIKYLNETLITGKIIDNSDLNIILFSGINGVGKTTSLAKCANYLKNNNKKVKIAAGDTFRAAATEQIDIWANRIKVPIIKSTMGTDSGALIYDSITSSLSDKTDYLLIDTAGRMYTSDDLMKELQKIMNICTKRIPKKNIENILVIDSTTGQNGFIQTETFQKFIPITGIFLSKYDSIFKGGSIIRICSELNIPVKFIGTGESLDDFKYFNKEEFTQSLGL